MTALLVVLWGAVLTLAVILARGAALALRRVRRRQPKRLELRFLSYTEADRLIRETKGAWTIAPEEDGNRSVGMVYLERLETP